MHVLIIPSGYFLPADDPLSGIFQYDLASALKRSGVRVGILSVELRGLDIFKKRLSGWLFGQHVSEEAGISVYRHYGLYWTPAWLRSYMSKYIHEGLRLFARYVNEQGMPDLIHAHNVMNAGILAAEIKRNYGVPYVITEHSSAYSREVAVCPSDYPRVRNAYIEADMRMVVSRSLGTIIDNYFGGEIGSLQVVPNMLDIIFEQLDTLPDRKAQKDFTFLNVGRMVEGKRQDLLLAAFALRFRGLENVGLRIVGGGSRRNELEMLADEMGVSAQVMFTGELERARVLEEMLDCDVYVHSSSFETFGVVIIEAMACGKPVVATSCGGPDDIITSENGKLVPVGDIEALADAMEQVKEQITTYDSAAIRKECLDRYCSKAVSESLIANYGKVVLKKRNV